MESAWARFWLHFRITLALSASSARKFLREAIEIDLDRLFLWTPVPLALGISLYFALPEEPPLYLTLFPVLPAFLLALWKRDNFIFRILVFFCLGFALICCASHYYGTPLIDKPVGPTLIQGNIENIEQKENGYRLLIDSPLIEDLSPVYTPKYIYMVLTNKTMHHQNITEISPGMHIKAIAQLLPLSAPLSPHGFDFRLNGYFKGIGATGYILGKMELSTPAENTPFLQTVSRLRLSIQEKVKRSLEGDAAGLAITLLTGEKKVLSAETNEAMRTIGLAHLLAISGLHVGLLAGIIFFLVRGTLALFPSIALRYPIKKWAAVPALAAIIFYMFLVGAPPSARRATIMAGIILIGILFDRASLSLHTVTLAALFILIFSPHFLLNPGFQLSFAAVYALISLHETLKNRHIESSSEKSGIFRRIFSFLGEIAIMSFAATLATAPLSLYHFQEASLYAMLANTLAIPLTSFVLMPLCVFFAILWPFGLEWIPLNLLQPSLDALITLSHSIADLPAAYYKPPQMPLSLLVIAIFGGLSFCFMLSRLRWIGLAILVTCVAATFFQPRPIVLISAEGTTVGWREPTTKNLYLTTIGKPDVFLAENWSPLAGMGREAAAFVESRPRLNCDSFGCLWTALKKPISWIKDPAILPEECQKDLSLIISPASYSLCPNGTPHVINRPALQKHGSYALFLKENSLSIIYERDAPAKRPWSLGWRPEKDL